MQNTLQMLQKTFDIDVSEARELNGKELEKWLEIIEYKIFSELVNQPQQKH